MTLSSMVGVVRDRLVAAAVPDLPPVDALAPASPADVPRITVSVEDAESRRRGVGAVPSPPQHGALRIETRVDLADPVLRLPGEEVALLSGGRRVLQLPHGAVVREDGTDTAPFSGDDLTVRVGNTTFTPVATAPAAGEVQLDVASGALTFPSALPDTGPVELGYFVGLWEVAVEHFVATLLVDVAHDDPTAHDALVTAIDAALSGPWPTALGVRDIDARAVSAAGAIAGLPPTHRTRRLTYRVEVERIEPVVQTSGGPIRVIQIPIQPFAEEMEISHE